MGILVKRVNDTQIRFFCAGCRCSHVLNIDTSSRPCWNWDGNVEQPTISPSVLISYKDPDTGVKVTVCHLLVKAGKIEYLNDCSHKLSGKIIDMEPYESNPD